MGLQTDIIFVKAIKSNEELLKKLPAHDIYNPAIAMPDEDLLNAKIPYIIVMNQGGQNDTSTKDDLEGQSDTVTIEVLITAKTRKQLGELTGEVRRTVWSFFKDADEEAEYAQDVPEDYQFSFGPVLYDDRKPAYWQSLTWQCDVLNPIYYERD